MTKKREKTYEMIYRCLNCNTKLFKNILYGEVAPILNADNKDYFCNYCGGVNFSHPRKPVLKDYME